MKKHNITDLNVVGMNEDKHSSLLGDANEMIVAGIITRWGFDVGMLNAKGGAYDLWVMAKDKPDGKLRPLRVQVKTVSKGGSIRLFGGLRAGRDRAFSQINVSKKLVSKRYKYTIEHNDMVIGVVTEPLALYLIPTCLISKWGLTKSVNKLDVLKNNYDILLNWNMEYLKEIADKLGVDASELRLSQG